MCSIVCDVGIDAIKKVLKFNKTKTYNNMKQISLLLLGMFSFICNSLFAEDIPNNEIWYEAKAKLNQTTDYKSSGIYASAFEVPIVSHTFANGKGVIKFNDEVKKIGYAAFMNCADLTSITVPNSVTEYGYWTLNGCNRIRSIQISKSIRKIEAGAFSGCGGLEKIIVESGNPYYDSRNNCNAIIETKSNTLLAGCKNTIIPNSVTAISSEAFYGCYDLKSITIPNSVKRIGYNAFYGCTSLPVIGNVRYADTNLVEVTDNTLTTYSIKQGTRFIGHHAFKDCVNLTNISIPRSVIRIESGAFEGCSSLPVIDNIRYADKYLVEVTDNKLSSYTVQDGTLIVGSQAFEGCWNMTSISMPNSVEIIDERAFSMCNSLSEVTFSTSLNSIGDDAFNGCDFNSLRIPNTVTDIGSRAFAQCHRLTDVQIPESVTKIGDGAFSSNEGLSTIIVDSNNPIYDSRDNCNAIIETATNTIIAAAKNTVIPNSVTAIGNHAYERRAELTSFTIPENISVIGDRAFSECWNLTEVNIPNTVTSLGEGAFFYCSALKDVVIPNSVKGTLEETFCYCRELQSVTLSNGVSYIRGRAFTECNNLTDLYCNAIVPPTIEDDWAFRYVPSNMKIHVPAVSIALYEDVLYWKNYEIVPIQNKNTIQVNLPADATDGQYKNMTLELVDLDRNQNFKLIVKDTRNYSFNNLEENTKYSLSLKTKKGLAIAEYKEINYTSGNLNIDIEKEKMEQLCVVNAKVLTPSNEDVTSQCTINWYDNNDDFISQGQSVTEQIVGTKVKLSVALSKDLGVQYKFPAELLYDITSSNNTCTIYLETLPMTTITGKVVDELTNSTLSNVTVTVSQTLNGKFSKLYSTKTDTNGKYSIQVYAVPASISYVTSDYITHTTDIAEGFNTQEEAVLETVKMKQITGTVITTSFTYRKCRTSSEDTEIENFYSDLNNVEYSILNESTGKSITKFSVQYPKIVLLEDVNEGDVLQLTATSKTGSFMPVVATATIDEEQRTNAAFNIVELGKIKATFAKNANAAVAATLYDAKGKLIQTFDYTNGTLTISDLVDGRYTLVTMGSSRLFNTIYDLAQLPQTGLVRLNDYVQHNVEVKSGEETTIDIDEVPTLDESKLYYTGDNTSFTVNKSSIVAGNYLTLTGHLDFKSAYAANVSNVSLIVDLPESCQFVENSVMVGNATSSYTLDGHRVTIPMAQYTDRVRFCIIPTIGGDYAPSALAQFVIDEKVITQPIGSANYTVNGTTINVPSIVANTTIPVSGTAIGASAVEIYDGDMLIGQTNTLANGSWATTCELHEPYNLSAHNIHAKVMTKTGLELQSENAKCTYDENFIQLKTVTMSFYNEWLKKQVEVQWNLVNNTSDVSSYMFYHDTDFTFVLDFTDNQPQKVSDVVLYVSTSNGDVIELLPEYNEKIGKYSVTETFRSSALPNNVNASYSIVDRPAVDFSPAFNDEVSLLESIRENVIQLGASMPAELISDEDEFSVYRVTLPNKKVTGLFKIRELNFESAKQYLHIKQFDFEQTENGYIYSMIEKVEGGFMLTLIDTGDKIAFTIECCDENSGSYQQDVNNQNRIKFKPRINLKADWQKYLKDVYEPGDWLGISAQFVNTLRDILGLNKYASARCFQLYFDVMDSYLTEMELMVNNIALAIIEQCEDDSYRLSIEDRNKYSEQLKSFDNSINAFYDTFLSYVELYKEKLANSARIDIAMAAASLGLSHYAQAGIGKLVGKGENHKFFQKWLSNDRKKGYWKNALGIASDQLIGGVLGIINPEKANFQGVENEMYKYMADQRNMMRRLYEKNMSNIKKSYKKCKSKKKQSAYYPTFTGPNVPSILDPSGFVYEGVTSNRLEGVTATAYYKENVEDMYGDIHENIVKWDAAEYAQENPLFTDENGMYAWDVPQGMWQVKFEKEGYETTYSEWLPVPPPQLDVNIAMKQNVQPSVKMARAYPDAVEVEFDKYMMPGLLTTDNIVVLVEGKPVSGSVVMLNEEASYEGSKEHYASKIRFNAASPFAADEVTLIVSNFVKSYAGIRMQDNYSQTFSIEPELCAIEVPENIGVGYDESTTLTITALPASAAAGKTLHVHTSSEMIASISDETVTLDKDGKAEITIFGELPGTAGITFTVDGYDFKATTIVGVTIPKKAIEVAAPKASLASGSEVAMGTIVTLSCETPDATIYYTLNGSCPCDETSRMIYKDPIVINESITIKAIAVASDLTESDIVEFTYTVSKVVDIDEGTLDETIKVFPLPVRDKLNVTADGNVIKSVTLVSTNGLVVAKAVKPETIVTLNVSTLASGIYFINVATEEKNYSRKIMKVE